MEQRVSVITLGVADLDRSRRFYEALGWRQGDGNAHVCFFQLHGSVLSLFSHGELARDAGVPDETMPAFRGVTLANNVDSKAAVDAVLAEAAAAGARIVRPAADTFWGGYSGYFADPDGHLWEVAWNPLWSYDAEGRVSLAPPAVPS